VRGAEREGQEVSGNGGGEKSRGLMTVPSVRGRKEKKNVENRRPSKGQGFLLGKDGRL